MGSLEEVRRIIQPLFPADWKIGVATDTSRRGADAELEIMAPDGRRAVLLLEMKRELSPARAKAVAAELGPMLSGRRYAGAVVCARYLSELTRSRLKEAGFSYLDRTGNVRLVVDHPAVMIDRQGPSRDPEPPRRPVKTLRGAKAARLVRALCDFRSPTGVRELATKAGTDPGYASRVLSTLREEDLVVRDDRGQVETVRWRELLTAWTRDYSVLGSNRPERYLAPRGLSAVTQKMRTYRGRYAVTGFDAVPEEVRVASRRTMLCYVDDPAGLAEQLDLRPADAAANVVLLIPFDEVVFARRREVQGLSSVALSQSAADLLTTPDRGPSQAEALLDWMERNEDAWRA